MSPFIRWEHLNDRWREESGCKLSDSTQTVKAVSSKHHCACCYQSGLITVWSHYDTVICLHATHMATYNSHMRVRYSLHLCFFCDLWMVCLPNNKRYYYQPKIFRYNLKSNIILSNETKILWTDLEVSQMQILKASLFCVHIGVWL